MKDYTKEIGFWKRLQSFVSDVQTNCCMGEEEKQMIMHNCKLKILDIQRVSISLPSEEEIREPIQNAIYATGSYTTDQCTEFADGILTYLTEAGYKVVRQ